MLIGIGCTKNRTNTVHYCFGIFRGGEKRPCFCSTQTFRSDLIKLKLEMIFIALHSSIGIATFRFQMRVVSSSTLTLLQTCMQIGDAAFSKHDREIAIYGKSPHSERADGQQKCRQQVKARQISRFFHANRTQSNYNSIEIRGVQFRSAAYTITTVASKQRPAREREEQRWRDPLQIRFNCSISGRLLRHSILTRRRARTLPTNL